MFPIKVKTKKVVNKHKLKAFFGCRLFAVIDRSGNKETVKAEAMNACDMSIHEMFFKGLGIALKRENITKLVSLYEASPFYHEYKFEMPARNGFRKPKLGRNNKKRK